MENCPRCKSEPAILDPTFGVLPGKKCQEQDKKMSVRSSPEFYSLAKQDRIQNQRDQNAADLIQPFVNGQPNPEFVRQYPEYIDSYYDREDLKKL